jgi:hypothetical protein
LPGGIIQRMGSTYQYRRHVIALDDDELEEFVRQWAVKKQQYVEVQRFTGTGDLGRDVVGFMTKARHEGTWDNYQCKQYGRTLPTDKAMHELGKILYYSFRKEFTPPARYFFVAPRGINRNIRKLIFNPSLLKNELVTEWDKYCANSIIENSHIPMSTDLQAFIEAWDFSCVTPISVEDILDDPAAKQVLYQWFGADPGPYDLASVPQDVQDSELTYVRELLNAYGEREGTKFGTHEEAFAHKSHGQHLRMQRERFFDADAFTRFYRDNTSVDDTEHLRNEVRHGVFEIHAANHSDSLERVDAVMRHAGGLQPTGPLAKYARIQVRQGICHHFVNDGEWSWRKS